MRIANHLPCLQRVRRHVPDLRETDLRVLPVGCHGDALHRTRFLLRAGNFILTLLTQPRHSFFGRRVRPRQNMQRGRRCPVSDRHWQRRHRLRRSPSGLPVLCPHHRFGLCRCGIGRRRRGGGRILVGMPAAADQAQRAGQRAQGQHGGQRRRGARRRVLHLAPRAAFGGRTLRLCRHGPRCTGSFADGCDALSFQ